MQTIHKYPFPERVFPGEPFVMKLPEGAQVRHFASQADHPCVWAQVEYGTPASVERDFVLIGTGREVPNGATYIGTIHNPAHLVWHLFEVTR